MSLKKRENRINTNRNEIEFANNRAHEIHDGLGGLRLEADGTLQYPVPENLDNIRRVVVHSKLLGPGLALHPDASKEEILEWNELLNKLVEAELKATDTNKGTFQIFSRIFIVIGKKKEAIDPWINLIPNEYGLCIVKSGLLILSHLSQRYADKRQKILNGFLEIRKVICDASLKRRSFQTDAQVCRSAGNLYVSIVDAIEELLDAILALSSTNKFNWLRKLAQPKNGKTDKKHDFDAIMQKVRDVAKEFGATIDACRDQHIETTHYKVEEVLEVAVGTAFQMRNIGGQVSEELDTMVLQLNKQRSDFKALQKQQGQGFKAIHADAKQLTEQLELLRSRETATQELVSMLAEERKKNKAMAARLAQKNRLLQSYHESQRAREDIVQQHSKAVVSLTRLLQILSAPHPDQIPSDDIGVIFERLLAQRDQDLETVLSWGARIQPSAQAQAHSLLNQDRFFEWMSSGHPDMLLVDGNLFVRGAVAAEKISAMSLLCANLILSMSNLDSTDIFLHFYCGLHSDFTGEWYGPSGLVRSLIIQLLATLEDQGQLDLNILDRRSVVQEMEQHDLGALCFLLHQLVNQFPPDVTVFLIIDGVSYFDLDFGGLFSKLATVFNCFQDIVEDDTLRPKLKILMTAPTKSSYRLGQVIAQRYRLGLPLRQLNIRLFSQRRVEVMLSQPTTSLIDSSQMMQPENGSEGDELDYDDD
ncbi:hypothetical protein GGI35DRAFT_481405 [Trichoderma velutinum]